MGDWFKDMPSEEWDELVAKAIKEAADEDMGRYRWQQAGLVGKAKILLRKIGVLGDGGIVLTGWFDSCGADSKR